MSTHNICFRREIRKILCGYPLLSVAVNLPFDNCPAKIQVSLCIHSVRSEASLGTWIASDAKFFHGDNEDSDQTVQMHRLI